MGSSLEWHSRNEEMNAFKRWNPQRPIVELNIVYALYMLSTHPEALSKSRAEHDQIIGGDIDSTIQELTPHPARINWLPYTTAVIK